MFACSACLIYDQYECQLFFLHVLNFVIWIKQQVKMHVFVTLTIASYIILNVLGN